MANLYLEICGFLIKILEREQISLKIGERLKEIRNTRQLTLDDVAELTGVSKPMLGQIERGQSLPTINVLWKISTGLKIPLSFFCRQQEAEYTVAGLDKENGITEENGGMWANRGFPLIRYGIEENKKCMNWYRSVRNVIT
jgi:transcriptional regulator with XRE-family HTH domain